jgi:hypothetical protein
MYINFQDKPLSVGNLKEHINNLDIYTSSRIKKFGIPQHNLSDNTCFMISTINILSRLQIVLYDLVEKLNELDNKKLTNIIEKLKQDNCLEKEEVEYYNKRLLLQTLLELDNDEIINSINEITTTDITVKRTYFIQHRLFEIEFYKDMAKYELYNDCLLRLQELFQVDIADIFAKYDTADDRVCNAIENEDLDGEFITLCSDIFYSGEYENIATMDESQRETLYKVSINKINKFFNDLQFNSPYLEEIQVKLDEINNLNKTISLSYLNKECKNSKLRLNNEILNNIQTNIFGIEFNNYIRYPGGSTYAPSIKGNSTVFTIPYFVKLLCGMDINTDIISNYIKILSFNPSFDAIVQGHNYDSDYIIYNAALGNTTNIVPINGYKIVGITYKCNKGGTDHSVSAVCYGDCNIDSYTLIDDSIANKNENYKNPQNCNIAKVELVIYENIEKLKEMKKKYYFMHGGAINYSKKIEKYKKKLNYIKYNKV